MMRHIVSGVLGALLMIACVVVFGMQKGSDAPDPGKLPEGFIEFTNNTEKVLYLRVSDKVSDVVGCGYNRTYIAVIAHSSFRMEIKP